MAILSILLLSIISGFGLAQAQEFHQFDTGRHEAFSDVFRTASGEYILCGGINPRIDDWSEMDGWIVKVDENFRLEWDEVYGGEGVFEQLVSLIETDDGDFVAVGQNGGAIWALRVADDGEIRWSRRYQRGKATAVIELKSGEFLICGYTDDRQGILFCVNGDGAELWRGIYAQPPREGQPSSTYLRALKETEGGVIAAGDRCTERGWTDLWVLKVDAERQGATVWDRQIRIAADTKCLSIVSSPDQGFLLGLSVNSNEGDRHASADMALAKIDRSGFREWTSTYSMGDGRNREQLTCAFRISRNRNALVGLSQLGDVNGDFSPAVIVVNDLGQKIWERLYRMDEGDGFAVGRSAVHSFSSGIGADDRSIIGAGGLIYNRDESGRNGFLIKIDASNYDPAYLIYSPQDTILTVLTGALIHFLCKTRDELDPPARYSWILDNRDTLSTDTTLVYQFDSQGNYRLDCRVSHEEVPRWPTWHISVRDLFVYSHTPDTLDLTLRRGTTQEFTLDSIAVTEGMSVNYAWTLTDIDNFDRFDLGEDSAVSVEFLRSGNYSVEGLAYRGEAQDNVLWTVRVRSAILDFSPGELSLSVLPDSLVNFEVIPFHPESDSLSFRWELDGDSVGAEAALGLRFGGDGSGNPSYQVAAMVFDGGEGDTVTWRVTVRPPAAAGEFGIGNLEFRIGEPAPNPFNATTTISYILDKPGRTRLSVFDLSGRKVARLADGSREAGIHSALWEASGLPAGVYLLRLESGGRIAVGKAVVVR